MAKVAKEVKETPAHVKVMRDKERELVKGKFIFHEVPGGRMEFVFRKYKQDPMEKFSLNDGEIYTLPLGVARHLNTNCKYPAYSFKMDETGRPQMGVGEWIRRCSFQSLEFVDIEEAPTPLKM